jgi:hypothetical protein
MRWKYYVAMSAIILGNFILFKCLSYWYGDSDGFLPVGIVVPVMFLCFIFPYAAVLGTYTGKEITGEFKARPKRHRPESKFMKWYNSIDLG